MNEKPILILPIETYAREIDHKLLLANYLALKTGCMALVAHSSIANKAAILTGDESIYIGKNIFTTEFTSGLKKDVRINNSVLFQILDSGSKIIFADEEGGLYFKLDHSEEDFLKMRSRLPVAPGDEDARFSNVSFCHWGEYQHELANILHPTMRHCIAGWPNVDAAKIYRNYKSQIDPINPTIGLTSNSTYLSNWANQGIPLYLSLSKYIDWHGIEEIGHFIGHETCLPGLAVKLTEMGHKVLYRQHPASAGVIVNEWIDYCNQHSIQTSNPGKIPSLEYLSRLSVNIHNGCSTAVTSSVLNLPTIRYREWNTSIGNALGLCIESKAENLSEVLSLLDIPKVPQLTDQCLKQVYGIQSDCLTSFEAILEEVQRFRLKSRTIQPSSLSSIKDMLHKQSIKDITKKILPAYTGAKKLAYNKFTNLYKHDIERNNLMSQALHGPSVFSVISYCSKGVLMAASVN